MFEFRDFANVLMRWRSKGAVEIKSAFSFFEQVVMMCLEWNAGNML